MIARWPDLRQGWRSRGLRLQLTLWYGAALIAILLVLGGFLYWLLATGLQHDAERQLAARAAQIEATLNPDESGLNFQEVPTSAGGEFILVYSAQGALLESSASGYRPAHLPAWATRAGGTGVYTTLPLADGPWLLYAVPLAQPGETPAGRGTFVVGRALAPLYAMLNQTLSALALVVPLAVLLACAGGYFLAGRALAPVATITRTARRIQAEGLAAGRSRIGLAGRRDELGELAATLDAMFGRLEETFARERRFTADAAHELRTPLAVVQAETSLALARPRRLAEYRRVLSVVESEAARMGQLVTDLLTLARADDGRLSLAREPVDLSALCQNVIGQFATAAATQGIRLAAELPDGITVVGDATWLRQLVANLTDNGVKYTAAGGWVQVRLTTAADGVRVSVADSGMGMPPEQLPHIFDRFYRADKSRSRDSAAAGVGLGLAICHWVAQAHGGHIVVHSQAGQGSCFIVHLPGPAPVTHPPGQG